jgi:O-antigen/teichoic acid export membrane protein
MSEGAAVGARHNARASVGSIGVSSIVSASLALVLLVFAGRTLGADGYSHFLVVWGLFFALTGVLPGLQQEVVRSVATARADDIHGREPFVGALVIGTLGLLVILASGPIWARRLVDQNALAVAAVLGVGFLCYAWANHVNGTLAATRQWRWYARAVLIDGVLRFLVVGGVLLAGVGSFGWAVALVAPGLTWALLAVSAQVRAATMSRGDSGALRFVQNAGHSMLSAGCSALVIAGFPVLLLIFGGDTGQGAAAGAVLAVLMATRAPLLLFLNTYQGVAITRLVEDPAPIRLMARWLRAGLAVSILAAVTGFAAGPTMLRLVFGSDYVVGRGVFVALVVSGFVLAGVTLTGWTALSLGRHSLFVSGWLTAVVATSALLTVDLPLQGRVSLALIGGPALGAAVHLLALRTTVSSNPKPAS